MSNRMFWLAVVMASAIVARKTCILLAPVTKMAQPIVAQVDTSAQEDTGEGLPEIPGHTLDWYVEHYDKNLKPGAPLEACFAPGTPADVVDFVEQHVYESNARYNLNTRWPGTQGTPKALTWSFVPDGLSTGKLMEPFINTTFDGPRHDDIRAGQRHYGDVSGLNNSAATARALGLCEVGSPIAVGAVPTPLWGLTPANSAILSIDPNGEQDFYKFTLAGARQVTVTVTPKGQSYASYPQDANCNNTVVNVNSLQIADLSIDLIDTNGTTVLATAAVNGLGVAETISNLLTAGGGDFYLKVYEANSPTESQLYTLDISVQNPPCTPPSINPINPETTDCSSAYYSAVPGASSTAPLTWSLSGSPPGGMTIDPTTGRVSWPDPVPSRTTYAIPIMVTNPCGSDATTLLLTVNRCPQISAAPEN